MDSFMKYVGQTFRCAVLYRSERLEPDGLNGYQHSYILRICQNPGISQEQLAKLIHVNKSNVTRQLNLLEQNGFITRSPCGKDKRIMQVYPTEKAQEIYPRVVEVLGEWNEFLLEDFTPEERSQLYHMMRKVMEKSISYVEKDHAKGKGK